MHRLAWTKETENWVARLKLTVESFELLWDVRYLLSLGVPKAFYFSALFVMDVVI